MVKIRNSLLMTNYVNELWLKWHFLLPQECVYNLLVRERERERVITKYKLRRKMSCVHLDWFILVFFFWVFIYFPCDFKGLGMDQKVKQTMKQQLWLWLVILVELTRPRQKVLSSFKRLDPEWLFNSSRLRKDYVLVESSSANMVYFLI